MSKHFESPREDNTSTCTAAAEAYRSECLPPEHFISRSPLMLSKGANIDDYRLLYKLRYQVYCHEANFLDPEDYCDGLEFDAFDAFSEHFMATTPDSNHEIVGTVRLVKWSEHLSFPTAMHFEALLQELERLNFPLDSTAEISRLCISKHYKRRPFEGLQADEGYTEISKQRRDNPDIILELFKILYCSSRYDLGITHWIASFEDPLCRLLHRYGVHLEPLSSEEIDYYGKVKIYGASIDQVEENMKMHRPEIYQFICEQHNHA